MLSNENSRESPLLERETRSEDNHDNSSSSKPSNEKLLSVAFVSFFVFTVAQTIAAYFAHSKAMMGDSIAMYVDAFTYAFNLWAERMKNRVEVDNDNADFVNNDAAEGQQLDLVSIQRRKSRDKRKMTLILELVPPLVSVTTLVTATIWILHDSISDLQFLTSSQMDDDENDQDDDADADAQPNTIVMMVFSSLNLLVDVINVFFFAKADHAFGYDTLEEDVLIDDETTSTTLGTAFDNSNNSTPSGSESNYQDSLDHHHHPSQQSNANASEVAVGKKSRANLNMCSAYTHVFADTIRSIAVLIAATLGECVDSITPEAADAAATVVVSAVILIALIPLVSGMKRTFGQLMAIWREESSEREMGMEMERRAAAQHSQALGTSMGTSSRLV